MMESKSRVAAALTPLKPARTIRTPHLMDLFRGGQYLDCLIAGSRITSFD
jgi:hypothetical protein